MSYKENIQYRARNAIWHRASSSLYINHCLM